MYRKAIFIVMFLAYVYTVDIYAQCVATPTDNCVEVHQSILDRAAKAIDELAAAQKAIAAFQNERQATEAERVAYKNLAVIADMAMAVLQKGIADRDKVIELQQKALDLYSTLVEKLTAKIDAPKSGWQKFVQTLKEIAYIALGIGLGRYAR